MDNSKDRFFTLVYIGELATCDDHNGVSATYVYCECRDTCANGSEIRSVQEALQIFVDSPVPQYPHPSLKLSEIAPNLLNGGMYMRNHLVLNGFELLVGDVGYIDGATFVLLGNIRELLGPPVWTILRVNGEDLSYTTSHTFELLDNNNQVHLNWTVRYEVTDGRAICAVLRALCPTSPAFDRIYIVNGSYGGRVIHYTMTSGEGSTVESPPIYFHFFPRCLDDGTPSPYFNISFAAEPDPSCGLDGPVDGVQEERGIRVEWISYPHCRRLLDFTQPISIPIPIPVSYLGILSGQSAKPLQRLSLESKADSADFDHQSQFWSEFVSCFTWWEPVPSLFEHPNVPSYLHHIGVKATAGIQTEITFDFMPNQYFDNSSMTLNIPLESEPPCLLTLEKLSWKDDPHHPAFRPKRNVFKADDELTTCNTSWPDFRNTTIHFLDAAYDLHQVFTHDEALVGLVIPEWQWRVGEPLRRLARAVGRVHKVLEECEYDFESVDPRSPRWWNACGICDKWDLMWDRGCKCPDNVLLTPRTVILSYSPSLLDASRIRGTIVSESF